MAKRILVPLKRDDQIEEIMPYMDEIARPGMKVVFLVRYPVDPFEHLLASFAVVGGGTDGMIDGTATEILTWEVQERLAEQRLSSACQALRQKGVNASVEIYSGSCRKVVENYAGGGEIDLVVMPKGGSPLVDKLSRRVTALFGSVKKTACPPALLLHPSA